MLNTKTIKKEVFPQLAISDYEEELFSKNLPKNCKHENCACVAYDKDKSGFYVCKDHLIGPLAKRYRLKSR